MAPNIVSGRGVTKEQVAVGTQRHRRDFEHDVVMVWNPMVVDYTRSFPRLWADSGPDGRQALVVAIFSRLDVPGFRRLEYELTPDAIDLGLDAALPPVIELDRQIGESGRGERASPSLTQQSLRFVMVSRTPRESVPAATARSA
jgi:hypothetical protein